MSFTVGELRRRQSGGADEVLSSGLVYVHAGAGSGQIPYDRETVKLNQQLWPIQIVQADRQPSLDDGDAELEAEVRAAYARAVSWRGWLRRVCR